MSQVRVYLASCPLGKAQQAADAKLEMSAAEFLAVCTHVALMPQFFVGLAVWGMKKIVEQRLPPRLLLAESGIALIGLGSFFFHATLQYSWQLADELPMISVSSSFPASKLPVLS